MIYKKYRLAFEYNGHPLCFFSDGTMDSVTMGGTTDVVVQSDNLEVMKHALTQAIYFSCGMNTPKIVQMHGSYMNP
jgi:hypothetical protein